MSPSIKQYQTIKAKYLNAIVHFRVCDNYRTINEDAITISEILGLTLIDSDSSSGVNEAASFPCSLLKSYLHKLVKAGHRVAICEQLEDPK